MRVVKCHQCGSRELRENEGYVVCTYCRSKFTVPENERPQRGSLIDIRADIDVLLQKCRDQPWNRAQYARLILDLDPTNEEAFEYLK